MTFVQAPAVGPLHWIYPFGQTPAISLTQDLPRGRKANALVLGNGDARNILFTLFNERSCRMLVLLLMLIEAFPRDYDFTCCHSEPAILGMF
jgi:hypothetical protein